MRHGLQSAVEACPPASEHVEIMAQILCAEIESDALAIKKDRFDQQWQQALAGLMQQCVPCDDPCNLQQGIASTLQA